MECQHPVFIHDPRRADLRDKYGSSLNMVKVPCGKCASCQANHRKMWFLRLKYESDHCLVSYVVTLTYNDDVIPKLVFNDKSNIWYHPLKYSDVQLFNKRLRKAFGHFRFFAIGEYGSEHLRPHYHICYFFNTFVSRDDFENEVFRCWFPECRITVDVTNDKAANYILKYCLKPVGEDLPEFVRPQLRCSTKPFIGAGLLNESNIDFFLDRKSDITNYLGYRQRLPRIYRDKYFDDDTKKFLSSELQRLMMRRSDVKILEMCDYDSLHGAGSYLHSHPRFEQFNSQVNRSIKLKSLK